MDLLRFHGSNPTLKYNQNKRQKSVVLLNIILPTLQRISQGRKQPSHLLLTLLKVVSNSNALFSLEAKILIVYSLLLIFDDSYHIHKN